MAQTRSVDGASVLVERTAGLTAAVGVFIMVSTAPFTITGTMGLSNVLAGAAIALIASFHAYRTGEHRSPSIVIAAVLALLGAWVAASPFVLDVSRELVVGINGIGGVLIAILSITGVYGSLKSPGPSKTKA